MEKIYVENNNKHKKNFDGVSILSFLVAVIAIISLIAVGFNQITFATNQVQGDELGNEFSVKTESENTNKLLSDKSFPIMMHFAEITCQGEDNGCVGGKKTIPIYCLQREKDTVDTKYKLSTDSALVNDYGLVYLMANLYPNVELVPSYDITGTNTDHKVETWISQALIWTYLKDTGLDPTSKMSGDDKQHVFTSTYIKYDANINEMSSDKVGYTEEDHILVDSYKVKGTNMTAKQVYEKALEIHKVADPYKVSLSEEGEVSVDDDNKYYFSKKITVQGAVADGSLGEFKSYSITIPEDAPKDTIIVGEDYKEIKDLKNISAGTKFYIRVPIDSVDEAVNMKLDVVGNFDTLAAYRYVGSNTGDFQELTALKNVPTTRPAIYNLDITPSPDTGSSMAQTIYFIGLIVLLCGVGIVYANAKSSQVKE